MLEEDTLNYSRVVNAKWPFSVMFCLLHGRVLALALLEWNRNGNVLHGEVDQGTVQSTYGSVLYCTILYCTALCPCVHCGCARGYSPIFGYGRVRDYLGRPRRKHCRNTLSGVEASVEKVVKASSED
jgi:hypothetical protein